MAAMSERHHLLVTRRWPMASVAFRVKFWSMHMIAREGHLASSSVSRLLFQSENGESQTLKDKKLKRKGEETP
jgi:hypothetical protein